jgi:VWFA-related protein
MIRPATRRAAAVATAVLLAGGLGMVAPRASARPQDPAAQRSVFRAGTSLVTVDTYPLLNGRIVEGLTAEDFDVFEDGKPQKIEAVEFLRIEPSPAEAHHDPNTVAESLALAADPHNRVFVAFLDVHHVRLAGGYYANRPLVDTLNRILAPNDLFGVMTPMMRPSDVTLGRKTDTVEQELTKHWSWARRGSLKIIPEGELFQRCYVAQPGSVSGVADPQPIRWVPIEAIQRSWEDQTLTALEDLAGYLGHVREARSSVLLLSNGWRLFEPDEVLVNKLTTGEAPSPGLFIGPGGKLGLPGTAGASRNGMLDDSTCTAELVRLARQDNRQRFREVVAQANRNNVTFYTVNPDGLIVNDASMGDPATRADGLIVIDSLTRDDAGAKLGTSAGDMERLMSRNGSLLTLANATGGLAVVDTNDLSSGLKRIVDEVSAYYLLGYYSTNSKMDGTFRRIEVKVKRPNVKVAARRGYLADAARKLGGAGLPASAAGSPAVDAALGKLVRLQPDAALYVTGVASAAEIVVTAELASRQLDGGKWAQGGGVEVVVTGANGDTLPVVQGRIEPGTRGAIVRVPIAATVAGPWRARVKVSGPDGAVDEAIDIAVASGSLIGEALVFRGTPSARSALRPVADMQFRRTERVHVEWQVLTPLDQRTARLLGKNGQPLPLEVALTEREQDGRKVIAADLPLTPLAPGEYVIELVVGAGAETVRKLVAFRVGQ